MIYATRRHMVGGTGHEHIAELEWRNPNSGEVGTSTRAVLVDWIDKGGDMRVNGYPNSRVGTVDGTPKHLRSYANRTYDDNLLSLPTY